MEKLIEIINKFEETLRKEIKIKALTDVEEAVKTLETSTINAIKEKFGELRKLDKVHDLFSSFESNFDNLGENITNKFVKLINAMRSLESESSPKSILVPKLDKIFEEIGKDNIFDISIYNEIVNDLKVRMEIDLVNKIERELFGVRDQFKENKRIPEILNEYRGEIQKSIVDFKQLYHDNFKSDKFTVDLDENFVSTVNKSFTDLSQEVDKLITEFGTALSAYQEVPIQLLSDLREEVNSFQQTKTTAVEELEKGKAELEAKLDDLEKGKVELEAISGDLDKRKMELEAKVTDLETAKAELEAKSGDLEKEKTELEAKIKDSETNVAGLNQYIETKTKQIEELETNVSNLEKEKETLLAELETKAKMLEELEKSKSELLSDKEQLTGELELKIKAIEDSTKELEGKNQVISDLELIKQESESLKEELTKKTEDNKQLETKISTLEFELKEVTKFLEKSPKYQLLFIINNLGKTSTKKLRELTKFDEGIITTALNELSVKDLITTSEEKGNIFVEIKQKLNPLSCLELPDVFDSEAIINLRNASDTSTFKQYFDEILTLVGKYKTDQPQVAGYLVSILYLFIIQSRNFQLFDKIQDAYHDLKGDSFYLKLAENALNRSPRESEKNATLEGLKETPELKTFTKELEKLTESDKAYPKKGPFQVKKYQSLSILNWDEEVEMKDSDLNQFSTVPDLVKWVWLNGQGSNFLIQLTDKEGNKHEIVISDSEKIDAHLFVKKQEVVVD
jgi:hypothetical protein